MFDSVRPAMRAKRYLDLWLGSFDLGHMLDIDLPDADVMDRVDPIVAFACEIVYGYHWGFAQEVFNYGVEDFEERPLFRIVEVPPFPAVRVPEHFRQVDKSTLAAFFSFRHIDLKSVAGPFGCSTHFAMKAEIASGDTERATSNFSLW